MHVMPYIAIPGLPFLRDITELDTTVHHTLQPYIRSYTNRDLMIQFLIQLQAAEYVINGSVGEAPSSGSQAMLAMGDDPSCHNLPGVHPLGTPLHSLATGIARDKAMSTL